MAHSLGIPVTAHLELVDADKAIVAGLDGIEHITSFGTALADRKVAERFRNLVSADNGAREIERYRLWATLDLDESPRLEPLLETIVKHNVFVSPTLAVFERREGDKKATDLAHVHGFQNMLKFTGMCDRAGATVVVGSHTWVPHADLGWAFQREMELLIEAGMSPMKVIGAATLQNARFLGCADRVGSIEPGKLADLVLVDGDPLEDIRAMYDVRRVMLNGQWVVNVAQNTSQGRNYDEANVGNYILPDPLLGKDGQRIADVESWNATRRGEILSDFRDLMYGHTPELPVTLRAETLATRNDAMDGLATRSIVRLHLFDDPAAPCIDLMLYIPNAAKGPNATTEPVPLLLGMSFNGNASIEADQAIPLPQGWMRPHKTGAVVDNRATESLRGISSERWPIKLALKQGYGVATFYYGDMEPDHLEGWRDGIRGYALKLSGRTKRDAHEWGALGAWAWGLSRALDYLETNPDVDASRVAVFGHSRLGKAALWAGVQDERFALVISNNSGEGGASWRKHRLFNCTCVVAILRPLSRLHQSRGRLAIRPAYAPVPHSAATSVHRKCLRRFAG